MDKLLNHLPALCNQIRRVAIEAGDLTLDYFDESGFQSTQEKNDGSPVTVADQEAENLIVQALREITPNTPIIGEELFARGEAPDVSNSDHFWLVDALDGTKEFITGSGDYTVNIGLIKNNEPVLGVVYVPFHGELYAGFENTAIRWNDESEKDKDIRTRSMPREGLTVMASKSHGKGEKLEKFLEDFKVKKHHSRGSSLKICMIAAGKADLY
ncbi:MAG: 3'(2'),5'-bisphosphate nucleotidase CysQ family protein, partial [Bdellovibrionales bacterium]